MGIRICVVVFFVFSVVDWSGKMFWFECVECVWYLLEIVWNV